VKQYGSYVILTNCCNVLYILFYKSIYFSGQLVQDNAVLCNEVNEKVVQHFVHCIESFGKHVQVSRRNKVRFTFSLTMQPPAQMLNLI
jgi:hypothetical protein